MPTYIVGDIQGCLAPLKCLLKKVNFDSHNDKLLSVGDIVNRGPQSLETLRFLKSLGGSFEMVLGNHDLHLIAIFYGASKFKKKDTLQEVLEAPDCADLVEWLRLQPLLIENNNNCIVHAGVPHIWSFRQAKQYAEEVESVLRSDEPLAFLSRMYGNQPDCWDNSLSGTERLRVITNYLTRMRVCRKDGTLELGFKGEINDIPKGFKPWFSHTRTDKSPKVEIFFGHWAALNAEISCDTVHALDSGCVWGNKMTLLRLEDRQRFTCDCELDFPP